jgi:outer membrane protein OmpA-like peptidoglycan-associated protein
MKKLLLFCLILIASQSFSQVQTVLDENFNDNTLSWYTVEDDKYSVKVENGKYIIESKAEAAFWTYLDMTALNADEEDFTIESSITQTSGMQNYGYGLVWSMYSDSKTYHEYLLTSTQYIKLINVWPGYENKYMDWTTNNMVNKLGKANNLKIEKRANMVIVYLNGQLIYRSGTFSYFGSKVGFYIGNKMRIEVDNIKITKQPKQIALVQSGIPFTEPLKLSDKVNTPEYSEVAPVISADGKTLFVDRKGTPENIFNKDQDDIWFSELDQNGEWTQLRNIGPPLNNEGHNFVISISPDNNTILVGNTYKEDGSSNSQGVSISHKTTTGWEIPKPLLIDGYYNDNDYVSYFLASDNKTLLMSIENKEGFGVKDIYVSFVKEDGSWTKPLNLGSTVNNWGDESNPFLAADGTTLFFSTDGLPGYGGTDVFVTHRLDDTWLNWSKPLNLGQPINSASWELGYFLTAKGDYAYLASDGDIYKVLNPERPEPVVLISGKVFNKKTKEPMSANIQYSDLAKNEELGVAISNPVTGDYKIVLPIGYVYSFLAEHDGFYSIAENIDVKTLSDYIEINKDLYLTPIEKGQTIRLNNLFFEFNKSALKSESYAELDRLHAILLSNPDMKIEIGGHTDDVGSDDYNMNLSRERANSVITYLVGKGIAQERLTSKGYGESKPEVPNTNDENRTVNRRVEFKIL